MKQAIEKYLYVYVHVYSINTDLQLSDYSSMWSAAADENFVYCSSTGRIEYQSHTVQLAPHHLWTLKIQITW